MVRIVEVSPRDGLQNEPRIVPTEIKARLIQNLQRSGLSEIEVTSFVSPKWVPQLADASELCQLLAPEGVHSALVPNRQGLERAIQSGIRRIALFTAASETFCLRNINRSLSQSLKVFGEVIEEARHEIPEGLFIRAYLSTAFQCPYEGRVDPSKVVSLTSELLRMGVDEVSLGDTIGVAGPSEVRELCRLLRAEVDFRAIAFHFHDTNGTAISNVAEALAHGCTNFDSSAAGLGGCPYAPGAGGNLATEDLIYFLNREGVPCPGDLALVAVASLDVLRFLGRAPASKAQVAQLARASTDSCAT